MNIFVSNVSKGQIYLGLLLRELKIEERKRLKISNFSEHFRMAMYAKGKFTVDNFPSIVL